jgi:hypothetical protein
VNHYTVAAGSSRPGRHRIVAVIGETTDDIASRRVTDDEDVLRIAAETGASPDEICSDTGVIGAAVPDRAPEAVPDRAPEVEPDRAPEFEPDRAPEAVPDRAPEVEPDRAPEAVPDRPAGAGLGIGCQRRHKLARALVTRGQSSGRWSGFQPPEWLPAQPSRRASFHIT